MRQQYGMSNAYLEPRGVDDGAATRKGVEILGRAHGPIREDKVGLLCARQRSAIRPHLQ